MVSAGASVAVGSGAVVAVGSGAVVLVGASAAGASVGVSVLPHAVNAPTKTSIVINKNDIFYRILSHF